MSSEWVETTWGDVATLEYGKAIRDYQNAKGEFPVYGTNGAIGWHHAPLCNSAGVVIGRKGAYRGIHYSKKPFFVINTAFYLKPKTQVNMKWAYYCLLTYDINGMDSGSAIPSTSRDEFYKLPVRLPSLNEQERIAEVLSIFDDRIALLRETNATLEAIAQALFKSWFVDFDPVHAKQQGIAPVGLDEATAALFPDSFEESALGLVPKGWRVAPVGDVVESVGGGTPDTKEPSYWESGIHCWTTPKDLSGIHAPVLMTTERKLTIKGLAKVSSGLLPTGTLLMSSRAPIGYLAIAQVPLAINQGYIAILPNSQLPPLYMLFWCRQNMEIIKGRANGSTFMEISKKAFRPIPALVPPMPVIEAFVGVAGTLFNRLVENEKQAQTLATLRDTLLPRLISGQLRLPEAEALLEKA